MKRLIIIITIIILILTGCTTKRHYKGYEIVSNKDKSMLYSGSKDHTYLHHAQFSGDVYELDMQKQEINEVYTFSRRFNPIGYVSLIGIGLAGLIVPFIMPSNYVVLQRNIMVLGLVSNGIWLGSFLNNTTQKINYESYVADKTRELKKIKRKLPGGIPSADVQLVKKGKTVILKVENTGTGKLFGYGVILQGKESNEQYIIGGLDVEPNDVKTAEIKLREDEDIEVVDHFEMNGYCKNKSRNINIIPLKGNMLHD